MGTKAKELVKTDVSKVICMLNKAYADEWLAAIQYWTAGQIVRGVCRKIVAKELFKHAKEEFRHVQKLAERIQQLGGEILLSPADIIREANCPYTCPSESCCCKIIEQTLASERCAIDVYHKMMDATRDTDPVTYCLLVEILKDELEHEEDFQTFQDDHKMMHERLKAMLTK